MRVYFYDGQGAYLGREDVALGQPGSLSIDWRQVGGRFTAPAGTASLRIQLFSYLNSGWVAFDDLALAQVTKYYFFPSAPDPRSASGQGADQRVAMRKEGCATIPGGRPDQGSSARMIDTSSSKLMSPG